MMLGQEWHGACVGLAKEERLDLHLSPAETGDFMRLLWTQGAIVTVDVITNLMSSSLPVVGKFAHITGVSIKWYV